MKRKPNREYPPPKLRSLATERSKKRYAEAAYVIPPTTLNEEQARALDRRLTETGLSVAALLRELICKGELK